MPNSSNRNMRTSLLAASRVTFAALVLASSAIELSGCSNGGQNQVSSSPPNSTSPSQQREVTLRLDWTPSAEYIAVYAADAKGYYKDRGIKVNLEPGSGSTAAAQLVGTQKSNFGFAFADAVLAAASKGIPIRVLAVTQARSPGSVVSLEKTGINSFKDLKGKKVSVSLESFAYLSLLRSLNSVGLSEKDVTIVPAQDAVPALRSGKVDAVANVAYLSATSLDLAKQKYKQLFFDPKGSSAYGQTIITSKEFSDKNPEVTQNFVDATLKGMDWVNSHPDEATALAQKVFPKDGDAWNKALLKNMLPFWQGADTKTKGLGYQNPSVWQAMQQVLLDGGVIKQKVDLTQLVDTKYFTNARANKS
jgi:ABC-type nitrate/sulfonate/bicarbonate transport system substrate-binding protein